MRYEEYLEKLKNAVEKKLGCPIEIKKIKKIKKVILKYKWRKNRRKMKKKNNYKNSK